MPAVFGLVVCTAGGIGFLVAGMPGWAAIVLFVLAGIALVDIGVIARRKAAERAGLSSYGAFVPASGASVSATIHRR